MGRKRKTHEEFVNEMKEVNLNIEILGQYKNIKTHINCKCKVCNHEWNGIPNNLIRGAKCPNCAREKKRLLKLKTHEQFVEEMKIVNPNIEILGKYIHSKEKIKCKCKICNNVWEVIPNDLLIGHGCPICANKSTGDKARKSQEQFIADMAITHPELEVLGKYKGNKIKITCRCKECGNIFDMTPNSLLGGQGCPPCSRQRGYDKTKLTNEEFLSRLELLKPTYKVIDKYITCETKVRCSCNICGGIWKATPTKLLNGRGCPICVGKDCVAGINDIATKRPDLIKYFVDKEDATRYTTGSGQRLIFKCPDCGQEKEMTISVLTCSGFSCDICSDSISYPNKYMRGFLSQLPVENVDYEYSPEWIKPLRYDGYFEYNGQSYIMEMDGALGHGKSKYGSKEKDIEGLKKDKYKESMARQHNIKVIRIDCEVSESDYISNNIINSELVDIFDLSSIDWNKCNEFATKNIVKEVCDYFNKTNLNPSTIAKVLKLGNNTVRRYLKRGTELGWCNYQPNSTIRIIKKAIDVFDMNNNKLHHFESLNECCSFMEKQYGETFDRHTIGKTCRGEKKSYKGFIFKYVA